jgi:spore coat polysaccharide biosynthesis protein SpsF (cytidylyltransferase family)
LNASNDKNKQGGKKMKYYVFEDGWDVNIYTSKKEAVDDYEITLDRLSDYEKEKKEYFRVYEIETDKDLDEIADLMDYMTEMIFKLK